MWLDKVPGFYSPVINAFSSAAKFGFFGVQLFFAISGYILSEPLWNNNKFSYGRYLLRRVSRIEPPFFICVILFTLMLHYIGGVGFHNLEKEFFTTIFYVHNIVVPQHFSTICGVSWSLEIEVQFYLLIPLIIILLKKAKPTLAIMLVLFLVFYIIMELLNSPIYSLINYINYFWIGVIVSYLKRGYTGSKLKLYFPGANFILIGLIFYGVYGLSVTSGVFNQVIQWVNYALLFLLFYNVMVLEKGIKFLSLTLVSTIGGMCYTIYLIHYTIINIGGYFLLKKIQSHLSVPMFFGAAIILLTASVAISACLFLVIEKPFMVREWYRYGFRRRENTSKK